MIHPNDLYNVLRHLGLTPNEEMSLPEEEKEKLLKIYEEVVLSYFRTLFPRRTKQNFLRKRRDEFGRVEVDILCRSCGRQITAHNQRRVFCKHPAPCKDSFNEDKKSLFTLLDTHGLALADWLGSQPTKERLELLLEEGKVRLEKTCSQKIIQ